MLHILSFSLIIFIFSSLHAFSNGDDLISPEEKVEAERILEQCQEKVKESKKYLYPYQKIVDGPYDKIESASAALTAKGIALLKFLNLPDHHGDVFKAVREIKNSKCHEILKNNQFLSYLLRWEINESFKEDSLPHYGCFEEPVVNGHTICLKDCFGTIAEFPEKYLFYEASTIKATGHAIYYSRNEAEGTFGDDGQDELGPVSQEQILNTPYLTTLDIGYLIGEKGNPLDVTNLLKIMCGKGTPDEKLEETMHFIPNEEMLQTSMQSKKN